MTLLLLYVGLALCVSFMCSVLEAVLLSVTPAYVANLEPKRPSAAALLRGHKKDVDRPLAAILILNTIANTAGAAAAGAQASVVFGSEWLGVFSGVLTFLILLLSEIIPKTLGAVYWQKLAPLAAHVLWIMLMPPFGWAVSATRLITRVLRRGTTPHTVSKEEVTALARLGEKHGIFDPSQTRVLENVFRLGALRAYDIMTPRTVMVALEARTKVRDAIPPKGDPTITMPFSRIPVYRDRHDEVIGYVLKSEILLRAAHGELDVAVGDFVREMVVMPETVSVAELFEELLDRNEHIALVVDEYGGVDGVVTMEDVLETLLGLEIVDEADHAVDLQDVARRRWQERRKRVNQSVDSR